MIDITRRQALAGMGSLGASIGLSACSTPITPFCPTDPTISDPSAPLTIDVHTHVFNGSDLQIDGFFRWVVLRNSQSELGAILQELGRDFAPTAAEELAALQEIGSVNRACDIHASSQVLQTYGQERYPPMGFAPLGNASFDNSGFWNRPWIPPSLQRSDLGKRMDDALSNLYSWCLANGVPIMGHASATNGPSDSPNNNDFQNLTLAKHWEPVPAKFLGIRVDFGHYGYIDL